MFSKLAFLKLTDSVRILSCFHGILPFIPTTNTSCFEKRRRLLTATEARLRYGWFTVVNKTKPCDETKLPLFPNQNNYNDNNLKARIPFILIVVLLNECNIRSGLA